MDRLTARSPKSGQAYLVGVKEDEQAVSGSYNTLNCILEAFNRLAEHEEADLAAENARLTVALQATIAEKEQLVKCYAVTNESWRALKDVAEAAKDVCLKCKEDCKGEGWAVPCRADVHCEFASVFVALCAARLEG